MSNHSTNYLFFRFRYGLSIFLLSVLSLTVGYAQERTVSGTVTSLESDEPLPGVNVIVKGTTVGTVTNIEGDYRLQVPADADILQFSFIGYTTEEVEIDSQSEVDMALAPDIQSLEEVVVVGYGEQSERFSTQQISEVDAEALADQPVVNVQELLQGRAAGVQVAGTSGVLGARPNLRIRGASSISAGNQPLYVVDGVPLNDGEYSNDLGARSLNPLQNLNPNDIESMSVLKDASAVAIYGSRGANGVILITTKQGAAGAKTVINLDYYTGVSEPTNFFDMMNADQYRQFRADYAAAQGATSGTEVSDYPEGSFDWPNAVLRTGRINQYALSARGGSEKTTFYVGGTYYNEEGFTIGNEIDKLNAQINLTHNPSDRLSFGVNLSLSAVDNDRISSDNSTAAPLTSAYLQQPYVQPYEEDGVTFTNTGFIQNVLAREALSVGELITRRTTGNFFVEYDLLEGLALKSTFGVDLVQTEETIRNPDIIAPGGYGYKRVIQDNKWLNTTTLNFDRTLAGVHNINVLLGFSYETSNLNRITVEGSGFASDALPNVASAATPTQTSADAAQWALASQFARANYRLMDRYLLEASVRRDGSSRFGSENRYGVFWSVGGGWILSEEPFMQGLNFLDLFKLRASYGTAGNDRVGELNAFNLRYYPALGLYEAGQLSNYNDIAGIRPTQPASPDLQWEETSQLDVGFDLQALESRLNIEFSYYIKNTTNLLLEFPLPYTTGFADINRNAGELENRGIDLLISGDIIRSDDFSWNSSVNLGYLQNEVIDLPEDGIEGPDFIQGLTGQQRAIEGQSINTFFLVPYLGVNSQTGDAEWADVNGEPVGAPNPAARTIVGSAIPDWTGGWTNTFRYRGLELSVLFNFVSGNKIYRSGREFTDNPASSFNKSTNLLDYWQNPGDNAYFPALSSATAPFFSSASTAWLEDGDFIRLRTATLSYDFAPLLSQVEFLSTVRVYVTGRNLLTFAKTDLEPEVNRFSNEPLGQGESFFTPPQARQIIFGVNVGF